MKKILIMALIASTCLTLKAQNKPDTTALKAEIKTLSLAAQIVAKRQDISMSQGLPTLQLLNDLIQADMALLGEERKKGKKL